MLKLIKCKKEQDDFGSTPANFKIKLLFIIYYFTEVYYIKLRGQLKPD